MSVKVDITVSDISGTLGAGYDKIKIYRSTISGSGYTEITTPTTTITLTAGVSEYEFIDVSGLTTNWYRTTFYDPDVPAESSFSVGFKGTFYDSNFSGATYPEEGVFTNNDRFIIDSIRTLIGDQKELSRDYVSPTAGYASVSEDETTHSLTNPPGWPVSIELNGNSYTSLDEPYVNDYQFITFSGTTISTTSGILDVWYYHFRNSDAEILRVYNSLQVPSFLTADQVTLELKFICAAINILGGELRLSGVTSGVEVDIFEEIRINPKGGLDSRFSDLKSLLQQKKEIIAAILNEAMQSDLSGVLID